MKRKASTWRLLEQLLEAAWEPKVIRGGGTKSMPQGHLRSVSKGEHPRMIGAYSISNEDDRGNEDHGPFESIDDLVRYIVDTETGALVDGPDDIRSSLERSGSYRSPSGDWVIFPWDARGRYDQGAGYDPEPEGEQ